MKYRLKKEATQFFADKLATQIKEMQVWKDHHGVDTKALEKVEELFIEYGHTSYNSDKSCSSSSLSGWDEKGSHFHFTVNFPSVKHSEYDRFSKGKSVRNMMNNIQNQLNYFYEAFVNDDKEKGLK